MTGSWSLVDATKDLPALGFGYFHPCYRFLSGQLEARYDSDLPLSLVFSHPGFVSPVFIPLIIVIIFTSSSMSLSFMSSLDVFSPDSSSVCRHVVLFAFCLATFHVILISLPFRAGLMPIISSPLSYLIHVNVITIHSATLRVCMSMFHSFPPPSRFDRH